MRSAARSRLLLRLCAAASLAWCCASPSLAEEAGVTQLAEMPLAALLDLQVSGASKFAMRMSETAASVTVISAAEMRALGYHTLADVLASVRGVMIANDRTYSYVGVRGFFAAGDYNTRVLLLVNGHRTNDNVFDQAYIGAELGIDVAMFDRVEIIRGPASSLYGTSAFFAVVNVVTRTGASMKGASIEADAGTPGTQLARASFGRELAGGADVALSGTYERSSGVGNLYFPAFDTPGTNGGVAQNLDGEDVGEL